MSLLTTLETEAQIADIDGRVFTCRQAIESGHGFLIFLGYPEDRSKGTPEAVLTHELAGHLLAHGFSRKRSGLPLGSVRLLKFRKRLGIIDGRDPKERARRAALAKPPRIVQDIDGTRFRVRREQKTDLGVTILRGIEIGRPKTSPQVVLTPALAALIREWAEFPMKLDAFLPFDTNILMNLRTRLGLSWHDDRAAWWAERFGDLLTLTPEDFSARHGRRPNVIDDERRAVLYVEKRLSQTPADRDFLDLMIDDWSGKRKDNGAAKGEALRTRTGLSYTSARRYRRAYKVLKAAGRIGANGLPVNPLSPQS
ncbi:hypothetical protein K7H91_16640 [Martelella mediterranea]|uniref:hypothetical protein n=1 Tax=Martelella mediterranea TaxID=293089 RepID=UPI001E4905EC|nr:hypothetical protein [Martelella mediterranea]MCD1635398.1 hypothetical protein [Martelella mediterranea]